MKKSVAVDVNNLIESVSKLEAELDTRIVLGTSGKLKKLLKTKWRLAKQEIENENNHY